MSSWDHHDAQHPNTRHNLQHLSSQNLTTCSSDPLSPKHSSPCKPASAIPSVLSLSQATLKEYFGFEEIGRVTAPFPGNTYLNPERSNSRRFSHSSQASSTTLVSETPLRTPDEKDSYLDTKVASMELGDESSGKKSYFPSRLPQRRPLISYIKNDWERNPKYAKSRLSPPYDQSQFFLNEPSRVTLWLHNLTMIPRRIPRRIQRDLILLFLMISTTLFGYTWFLKPHWDEQYALTTSYEPGKNDVFGSNLRPKFTNMIHMKTLDSSLLPTSSEGVERLVFIGDVHGCKDELVKLLHKIDFRPSSDHLILTGDMVDKGPDTAGTIELAQSLRASCVRGNKEDRLLLAHSAAVTHERHAADDHLAHESPHGDTAERTLASKLSKAQLGWLAECPVILRVGDLPGLHEVIAVHAGLVPGVPLARQDPFAVMNMRAIDPHTRSPSADRSEGLPWWKVWNHHMFYEEKPGKRMTVVYGHDARTGVLNKAYSKGLDGGCVYGGRLTALVVEARRKRWSFFGRVDVDPKEVEMETKIVSVNCPVYKQRKMDV